MSNNRYDDRYDDDDRYDETYDEAYADGYDEAYDESYDEEFDDPYDEYEDDLAVRREPVRRTAPKKPEIKKQTSRYKENKRKRLARLITVYAFVTILVFAGLYLFYRMCHSDKEKYREEGITAVKSGSYEKALECFQKSLNEEQCFSRDMDLDTKMYMGACYLRLSRYSEASSIYHLLSLEESKVVDQAVVASMLETAEANQLLQEIKEKEDAKPDFVTIDRLKTMAASDSSLYLYLASAYNRRGEYALATDAVKKYAQEHAMNSYVAYELSAACLREEKPDEAAKYVEQGLAAADGIYKDLLQYNQVIILETQGKYDEAFQMIAALHTQYPENTDMLREFTFLDSRINTDPQPVNPYSDALTDQEWEAIRRKLEGN